MRIHSFTCGGWAANCYLAYRETDAVLIDPSVQAETVLHFLQMNQLSLKGILLTHGHFDHILALDELRAAGNSPVYLHREDADFLGDPDKSCYRLLLGRNITHAPADILLTGGETLTFGSLCFTVLHTPGHTGGSVCYHASRTLFSGDTIFADGVGRTDLPGGSLADQQKSLDMLAALNKAEPGITIFPGHGQRAALSAALQNALGTND